MRQPRPLVTLVIAAAFVTVACFATLGACKKAKEVITDAIGPEGSAKAGAAAPAEATPPVDIASQGADPLVRKDFAKEVQGGDAGPEGGTTAGKGEDNVVDAQFEEVKDDKKKSA